jgi:hypothetical protein
MLTATTTSVSSTLCGNQERYRTADGTTHDPTPMMASSAVAHRRISQG